MADLSGWGGSRATKVAFDWRTGSISGWGGRRVHRGGLCRLIGQGRPTLTTVDGGRALAKVRAVPICSCPATLGDSTGTTGASGGTCRGIACKELYVLQRKVGAVANTV